MKLPVGVWLNVSIQEAPAEFHLCADDQLGDGEMRIVVVTEQNLVLIFYNLICVVVFLPLSLLDSFP